ncbi:MAG: transposase, partial [Fidelibacterota bacterium]
KKHLSVPDIKALLDVQDYDLSERTIYNVVKSQGFERLPRRSIVAKSQTFSTVKLEAPKSVPLDFSPESFSCRDSLGIVYLLQYVQQFRLDRLIENSRYPETKATDPLSSILSFLALKFFHVGRYTADDVWCMDRGLGLFAGRNVLPKAGWFRSYSHRVTRQMNMALLKGLHKTWQDAGLLSDTANLDFTAIPYWGNASHLENNWSGTRHKALASILAVLAQEPDSGIITYSDTNIRHGNKSQVILEFLDFYKANGQDDLKYLVFDSKFTTYENLARLDPDVKFLTIRRRGKNIVEQLNELPSSDWKTVRVPGSDGKGRILKVHDTRVVLRDYGKEIRQIAVTGHGKIKPALLITNDLDSTCRELLHKYARRWLVEKSISEQIQFFHLNTISSSMVIKVNFDLTMSILAHNILRLFARDLPGYSHHAALTLYNKFLRNSGSVQIANSAVTVCLKKKRNLPALLTAMQPYQKQKIAVLDHRPLIIAGDTTS